MNNEIVNSEMSIVSNCPLCNEHSLHVSNVQESEIQQCIACGYVTTDKFKIVDDDFESNKLYNELTVEMKSWSKIANNSIWTPTFMTLPTGMLFPFNNEGGIMNWGYAPMVDIPEKEQKDFPDPNGGFYTRKYDTDSAVVYEKFYLALHQINEELKNQHNESKSMEESVNKAVESVNMKLPKLNKVT